MKNGKIFLISFILVILSLLLYLFKSFLLVIIIASLMAVATSNINAKFLHLTKGHKFFASILTTSCMVILFFAPFFYTMIELAKTLKNFDISLISNTLDYIKNYQFTLPEGFNFLEPKVKEFLASIDLNNISKQALNYASSFTKSGAKFLIDMALICVFYFFANLYGTELVIYLKSIVPVDRNELDDVLSEVGNVMAVVLYSMVIIAIFQGTLFGIITMFYGYDGILMGAIFAVSSLIPAVGGALVYIPVSLYEFASNGLNSALIILIYSIVVISFIADTLIKPLIIKWINKKLVKTPTKINELLIFLAMIAGISSFGFWGIILGPAILTFFISTIRMYVILKDKKLI
ncbi:MULTISPECIES: AI-2E family transporter [Campylobacter]|uniref:AI-2E family transporter n=1 Tax=Campylobacter molothri TaxID=1032242 RepID=A0ACC5W103_9BACT|nr:AI-2E family transporter [Campylobacter sp. RM10542]MBZ7949647.1 AI-2E family transporter [Campylobacter sp. RM10534]MBZ7958656.1 AI-2E family transporter [Campylobacter sp. RM9760]MBZ7960045.1 AI-2E family transporter [Campylobacter sp. RM12397]MBZ7970519.1 AI-2E family transporter [Campylobacter sp. RM3125]MBZ7972033.1 AI-2E family transporter [Campylobacter sp. RM3124]MBZ7974629.1 AI-2E family transporter [Campylobacter sp. RM9754]